MTFSRRDLMVGAGSASVALAVGVPASARANQSSRLLLLGTGGGPVLGGDRRMASSVIVVGDAAYAIDCGYGASEAMVRAGVSLGRVEGLFITHNHGDHMIDLGPMLFFSWLQGHASPIRLFGPPPLGEIARGLVAAHTVPLDYYRNDMRMPPMPDLEVREFSEAGAVFQDDHVRVTCALVEHPPVLPSLAYRFDLADRAIVFSGDTAPTPALVALARDADILVHEAADAELTVRMMSSDDGRSAINGAGGGAPVAFNPALFAEHVYKAHTRAEDAGRIAAEAGVKTLVLNHLSPGSARVVSDEDWRAMAARHFDGTIVVARDGMEL